MKIILLGRTWTVALFWLAATVGGAADEPADFDKDIRPILKNRCARCHSGHKRKGGFSIDSRAAILKGGESGPGAVPGQSAKSHLIKLVTSTDADERMPSKSKPLTPAQIARLRAWIDDGLAWPKGFSFTQWQRAPMAPRVVELPPGDPKENPVDRLVRAYWKKRGSPKNLKPADDRTFARRVWLDLVGTLPPPKELDAFVRKRAPGKRAQLVDRLLADKPAYAGHWLTFWSDMLRNAYRGTGFIDGGRKQITQWLYSALHTNLPYDRFVRELISPANGSEGFIKGIKWRGQVSAAQRPEMQAAQNIGQVFLGTNLKCASCHNSFINHWRIDDTWAMASVFAEKPLEIFRCGEASGRHAPPAFLYPELGSIDPKAPRAKRLAELALVLTDPKNGRLPRTMVNRFWAALMGRGIVEPVDDMDQPPWDADLLDWLAADLAGHSYDLKRTLRLICTSRVYQMRASKLPAKIANPFIFRGPMTRRMSAEQFLDAVCALTRTSPGKLAAKITGPNAAPSVRASLVNDDPLSRALGRPNREQVVTQRDSLATTTQALELTNGTTLDAKLKAGARFWMGRAGKNAAGLAGQIYLEALGRAPSQEEARIAVGVLGQPVSSQGIEDLLWIVTMLPEFQLIR